MNELKNKTLTELNSLASHLDVFENNGTFRKVSNFSEITEEEYLNYKVRINEIMEIIKEKEKQKEEEDKQWQIKREREIKEWVNSIDPIDLEEEYGHLVYPLSEQIKDEGEIQGRIYFLSSLIEYDNKYHIPYSEIKSIAEKIIKGE
jgi:hypothetical protein